MRQRALGLGEERHGHHGRDTAAEVGDVGNLLAINAGGAEAFGHCLPHPRAVVNRLGAAGAHAVMPPPDELEAAAIFQRERRVERG